MVYSCISVVTYKEFPFPSSAFGAATKLSLPFPITIDISFRVDLKPMELLVVPFTVTILIAVFTLLSLSFTL